MKITPEPFITRCILFKPAIRCRYDQETTCDQSFMDLGEEYSRVGLPTNEISGQDQIKLIIFVIQVLSLALAKLDFLQTAGQVVFFLRYPSIKNQNPLFCNFVAVFPFVFESICCIYKSCSQINPDDLIKIGSKFKTCTPDGATKL